MSHYFSECDEAWRGIGVIPASGVDLKPEFDRFNARKKYQIEPLPPKKTKCRCGEVIRGRYLSESMSIICESLSSIESDWSLHGINRRKLLGILSIHEGEFLMEKVISLAHGDGGELSHRLIHDLFVQEFGHQKEAMFDASMLDLHSNRIAVTTDSFVIKPIFFPGGTIGKLSVAGTVNDLAVSGAKPLYLTCGFVIEEGFPIADLQTIVTDMAKEAKKAGVSIIAGDTKVVERGSCDGVYINTTGIGIVENQKVHPSFQAGDAVIVSGTLGDHGFAILAARGELGIQIPVNSDCASLNAMLADVSMQWMKSALCVIRPEGA